MFLLASDYDNTLKKSGYDLRINIFFLKRFREEGNLFLLNTGRSYQSIKREIDKYKIPFDYLSCNGGNILLDKKEKIVYAFNMEASLLNELEKLKENFFLEINPIQFQGHLLGIELVVSDFKDMLLLELDKMALEYNLSYKISKNSGFYHIYVYSSSVSKSTPIEYLRTQYHLQREQIYTVGDHYNDLEMIRDYNGYTMLWAKKALKDVSLGSTPTVAQLIKKIGKRR